MLSRLRKAFPQIKTLAYLRVYSNSANTTKYVTREAQDPPENLRKNFEKFQREDGVPVYLKGGLGDRLLYLSTLALLVIGVSWSYYTLLTMAFPPKKQ